MNGFAGRISRGLVVAILAGAGASTVHAQATRPAEAHRPLLDQLNHETEGLYHEVSASLVRVQLPQPRWMNAYAMAPMDRWDKLAPDVRKRLEEQVKPGDKQGGNLQMVLRPATGANAVLPQTQPAATTQPVAVDPNATIVFVPASHEQNAPPDPIFGAKLQLDAKANPTSIPFAPNNVGILLDDVGHVLVPLYIEPEAIENHVVRVAFGDGKVRDARFVGSDRQTNLTLLEVQKPEGKPVQLSAHKPGDGALVLFISPLDGSGRLGMWNGGQGEYGFVFTTDGSAAGITRYGQFLGGSACQLIAEQLIHYGSVRRATLGVVVSEIRKDDPLRRQLPVLGSRSAMRIDEVASASAAEKAGLKPGDLLLALAGESISDIPSLAAAIAACSGATELQVLCDGQVVTLKVELEPRPLAK